MNLDTVKQGLDEASNQGAVGTLVVVVKKQDGSLAQINRIVYKRNDIVLEPSQSHEADLIVIELPQD